MSSQNTEDFYTAENLEVMDALAGTKSFIPGKVYYKEANGKERFYKIHSRTKKFAVIQEMRISVPGYSEPYSWGDKRRVLIRTYGRFEEFAGNYREYVHSNSSDVWLHVTKPAAERSFRIDCPDCRDLHQIHGHAVSKSEWDSREKLSQEQPPQS